MSGGLGGLDPFVVLPFCLDLLCGASDYNVLGFNFFGSALDRFFTITKKYLDLLRNR